jgi:hypothetical protein
MVSKEFAKKSKFISKEVFFTKLEWVLGKERFESLETLCISPEISTTLIYNTNDLCLNKEQFDVLMKNIDSQDTVYIDQKDSDEVYEFVFPISYDEYQSLNLFSMTFISSSKFDWIVIIDEELESGIGVIAAADKLIDNFNSQYKKGLKDLHDLISFYHRNTLRNPLSIQNLIKILSLLHVTKSIKESN